MQHPVEQYNSILGVKNITSVEQLKQAYRSRAKYLHPDRNKSERSHEQFVLLHEAYEFYTRVLTNPPATYNGTSVASKKYPEHYYSEVWQSLHRQEARKRAAERAKRKEAVFEQKGYYRILDRFLYIITLLRIVQALALLIGLPVFLFYQDGFRGLICVLLVQLFTYPVWSPYVRLVLHPGQKRGHYRSFRR